MLNRHAGAAPSKADEIIQTIGLKPGDAVADIGAGGGYFALRFAQLVGSEGKVYAIDVDVAFLKIIKENAIRQGLTNLITVPVKEELALPKGELDVVFMRNVTHHLTDRVNYFARLKEFLKKDGRVVIIEFKREHRRRFLSPGPGKGHYVPRDRLVQEMQDAGYVLKQEFHFLPEQHFTIYQQESGVTDCSSARG